MKVFDENIPGFFSI